MNSLFCSGMDAVPRRDFSFVVKNAREKKYSKKNAKSARDRKSVV